jgi:hypothetical protein
MANTHWHAARTNPTDFPAPGCNGDIVPGMPLGVESCISENGVGEGAMPGRGRCSRAGPDLPEVRHPGNKGNRRRGPPAQGQSGHLKKNQATEGARDTGAVGRVVMPTNRTRPRVRGGHLTAIPRGPVIKVSMRPADKKAMCEHHALRPPRVHGSFLDERTQWTR